MEVTREEFARAVLRKLRLDPTRRRLIALIAWEAAEGNDQEAQAKWNPFNTTRWALGCTIFNWAGVKNYRSRRSGVRATVKTLRESGHGYEAIIEALHEGHAKQTMAAVERSAWGTGGLALSIVDDVHRHYLDYADVLIGQ